MNRSLTTTYSDLAADLARSREKEKANLARTIARLTEEIALRQRQLLHFTLALHALDSRQEAA
jgi:hypothetical protein